MDVRNILRSDSCLTDLALDKAGGGQDMGIRVALDNIKAARP